MLQLADVVCARTAGLRVAIFEPAESWCQWLQQALPAQAGAQVFTSAQALLAALQAEQFEILIVAFRPRDTDGFAWLQALRASPGGAGCWLIACIGAGDVQGASLARLAGASEVYCKVVDAHSLAQDLVQRLAVPEPATSTTRRRLQAPALPALFDPFAMHEWVAGEVIDERFVAFSFLGEMVDHVDLLTSLYGMPAALALLPLEAFAMASQFAGALRLAQYTELVRAELHAGGHLHPELRGEYVGLIGETGREIATWLLERPTRAG
ncbi:MAG: hypothetical protein QE285_19580 [Aquabacterium sp.]|nr:hypothetical protein [Aquabacterium sp.]